MKTCPSCGGLIGRDCFNPVECAWITQQINAQYAVDDFVNKQHADYEREQNDRMEREYNEYLEAEYNDFNTTETLQLSPILHRFLIVN